MATALRGFGFGFGDRVRWVLGLDGEAAFCCAGGAGSARCSGADACVDRGSAFDWGAAAWGAGS